MNEEDSGREIKTLREREGGREEEREEKEREEGRD